MNGRRTDMNIIAAVDSNWAIGYRNDLLVRIQTSGQHSGRYEVFPSDDRWKGSCDGKKDA